MEVMNSFELDRMVISLSRWETISFQMFCEEHLMSFTDFSMRIRLVDVEYAHTESYSQLHIDLLVYLSPDQVWNQTLQGRETYVCSILKVFSLGQPPLRYLYTVLSKTLTSRNNSTGVMNLEDLMSYGAWCSGGDLHQPYPCLLVASLGIGPQIGD